MATSASTVRFAAPDADEPSAESRPPAWTSSVQPHPAVQAAATHGGAARPASFRTKGHFQGHNALGIGDCSTWDTFGKTNHLKADSTASGPPYMLLGDLGTVPEFALLDDAEPEMELRVSRKSTRGPSVTFVESSRESGISWGAASTTSATFKRPRFVTSQSAPDRVHGYGLPMIAGRRRVRTAGLLEQEWFSESGTYNDMVRVRSGPPPAAPLGISDDIWGAGVLPRICKRDRRNTVEIKEEILNSGAVRDGLLMVDTLSSFGFSLEDLERVVYADSARHRPELPHLLDHVILDSKGGLENVAQVWDPWKYLWFLYLVISIVFNVCSLIAVDWGVFVAYGRALMQRSRRPAGTYDYQFSASSESRDVVGHIHGAGAVLAQLRDRSMLVAFLHLAGFVAVVEMLWLLWYVVVCSYLVWVFNKSPSECRSYKAIVELLQRQLPQLCTVSGVKFIAQVHPSLVYNEFLLFCQEHRSPQLISNALLGTLVLTCSFVAKRLFFSIVALGAFAVKVLVVAFNFVDPSCSVQFKVMITLAFMTQCMGCVPIEVVLQDRIFLFVFGGKQSTYQEDDHAYKKVYESLLAKHIWQFYWHSPSYGRLARWRAKLQAIIILATFDHYDLQKLLIQSDNLSLQFPYMEDVHKDDAGLHREGSGGSARSRPFVDGLKLSPRSVEVESNSEGADSDLGCYVGCRWSGPKPTVCREMPML